MVEDRKMQTRAAQSLQEFLNDSCIPRELWEEITLWLKDTELDQVYVDPVEAVGAWWGNQEAEKMGLVINFAKCGLMPAEWCPQGEDWKVAQAEAKFRFVASYQQLLDNGALVDIHEK